MDLSVPLAQARRLMYLTESDATGRRIAPHQFTAPKQIADESDAIASACNHDERFAAVHAEESPDTITALVCSEAFQAALDRLGPRGLPAPLGVVVAAVFQCRVAERKAPKHVAVR